MLRNYFLNSVHSYSISKYLPNTISFQRAAYHTAIAPSNVIIYLLTNILLTFIVVKHVCYEQNNGVETDFIALTVITNNIIM